MGLPKFILLKSNETKKFLCYEKEEGPTHASLRFCHEITPQKETETETKTEVVVESPVTEETTTKTTDFHFLKFEVEEAKTAEGFVHIRTCYNNKYWVRKLENSPTICAEANEPEEDQSKWNCTLFKPIILGPAEDDSSEYDLVPPIDEEKPQKIQLVHVSQQQEYYVDGSGDKSLEDRSSASSEVFIAYNVVATAILPEHVTFIGHDGTFMSNFENELMGFVTKDVGARGVAMLTVPRMIVPQFINLRIRDTNRNWWLYARFTSISAVTTAANTRFGPIQVGGHIALRVQANNNFIHRTVNNQFNGVAARAVSITEAARFRVGEPVLARQVLSANYDLVNARVYELGRVEKYVDSRTNNTNIEQTGVFAVEYTESQTMSWNQSLTVHMGIAVTLNIGIPFVGELGISVSYERTQTAEWGEERTEERTVSYTQNITIPPRKRVTLRVMASRSACDVPFSCVVRDVMTNGVTRQYTKTDGLFVGSNEFRFNTIIEQTDI